MAAINHTPFCEQSCLIVLHIVNKQNSLIIHFYISTIFFINNETSTSTSSTLSRTKSIDLNRYSWALITQTDENNKYNCFSQKYYWNVVRRMK